MDSVWLIVMKICTAIFVILLFCKIRPWWKKMACLLVSLAFILLAGFHYMFPDYPSIETTGKHKVMTETIYFSHETKFPDLATEGKEREIPAKVWLPEGADNEKFPLIIYSHGSFGIPEANESLFNELASHGYAIMSLAHPHHSFSTQLSNGESVSVDWNFFQEVMTSQGSEDLPKVLNNLRKWVAIRVEDLNFIVDCLQDESQNNEMSQFFDQEAILLAGHSLGGSAALQVGRERSKDFKAVISLEAPFIGDIMDVEGDHYTFIAEEYPLPILHFYSDAIWDKIEDTTTYTANLKLIEKDSNKFMNVHISGSGHLGLTDLRLFSPLLTNLMDGRLNTKPTEDNLKRINEETLRFLDQLALND